MNYYIDALRNYVNFSGRATRTQFWMFVLVNFIVGFVLNIILFVVPALAFIGQLYNLLMLLPSLAINARRLHDTGRSGWWQLLVLVPVVGWLIMLIFYVQPSMPGANRFDCCCGCCRNTDYADGEKQGE